MVVGSENGNGKNEISTFPALIARAHTLTYLLLSTLTPHTQEKTMTKC